MEDSLSEVMSSLPPGFRFHATDEELLILYLKPKILGQPEGHYSNIIPEIDVCEFEPWQLPDMFDRMFNGKELVFYCRFKRKYSNSRRSDRTTGTGYWKVTGKERPIMSDHTNEQIGIKKTLVFYTGRVPRGERTNWVMHEYHLKSECLGDNHGEGEMLPYVACRIKNKKDKKLMTGRAPTISPEGYSSSPYTCSSDVSDPPVNQEGDLLSFSEVADNQGAVDAQPEMSPGPGELMDSLSPFRALDDFLLDLDNTPTYPTQAGAEEEGWLSFLNFPDNNNGSEFGMPSPNSNFGLGSGNV